ncbi:hypothetical protein SEVIR_5G218700v4 [Setaria viridis]|uniref:Acidic protein n=1 Tax=Setaria viridis TaxID=4556 RepID=A0A4U6UK41_SETVI|nr:uncharacterized protein LOC117858254 [Setaria viridis]TKW15164.1 hypothetical protein SEVIR_5G218700v2 [Setaria viridis]
MAARLAVAAAAVAVAVAAAAALPLLAAGAASDDCFENCFKHCVGNDKSMTDYCNYACGMTCGGPDNGALRTINCQLACVRDSCRRLRADGNKGMEACYGQCYDGCETKAGLPRPLRAGVGAVGAAVLPYHHFHEMQDAVQPTSEPDPDDASRRARGPFLP